jgi:hypothetical protein
MKLWLDDQCDIIGERMPPKGWVGTKSAITACALIKSGEVEAISFDHDLGTLLTGYTVAKFIEKHAYIGDIPKIKYWEIHSANPVGRDNIVRAMNNADKFWREWEE